MNGGLTGHYVHRDALAHNGFLNTAGGGRLRAARWTGYLSIVYYI
jgi:hypothetical protein